MTKILFDFYSLATPFMYTFMKNNSLDGLETAILKRILKSADKFKSKELIFCFEGGGDSHRIKLYPGYKADRRKRKEEQTDKEKEFCREFFRKCTELRSFLENVGFNCISIDCFEADDILCKIPTQDEMTFEDFVIVTGDKDLNQVLANNNCKIYNPSKDIVITEETFTKEFGFQPKYFYKYLALVGDASDSVPGCNGIGPKNAIKYINSELSETSVAYQKIKSWPKKERVLNTRLVKLPLPMTPDIKLKEDELSMEKFMQVCTEMGFDSFINEMFEEWSHFFNGGGSPANMMAQRRKQRGNR